MRDIMPFLGPAFMPVSAAFAALWLSARARAARAEKTVRQMAAQNCYDGPNRARDIEARLEAVAMGVERMTEGQRSIARALSELRDTTRQPVTERR